MRVLTLSIALLTLSASISFADGEVNIGWNDCVSGGGVPAKRNDCTSNAETLALVVSARPSVEIDHLIGVVAVIELATAQAILSPWWHLELGPTPGCRAGLLGSTYDFRSGPSGCTDVWQGDASGGIDFATPSPSSMAPNSARLRVICGVPASLEKVVVPTDEYNMCRIVISKSKSTGTDACAGCLDPVCFYVASIQLAEPAGVGDYTITSGSNQYLELNAPLIGSGAICPGPPLVPVHRSTWGEIKSLYH
jgi:hypothetical protein